MPLLGGIDMICRNNSCWDWPWCGNRNGMF